ncbi:hypothetical protein ACWEGE_15265 [Amycolatopsis sp. NPDC004747]
MSSKPVVPVAAARPSPPGVGVAWGLYMTIFASITALALVIRGEGVAVPVALSSASGVAILAVSLVNRLLGGRR